MSKKKDLMSVSGDYMDKLFSERPGSEKTTEKKQPSGKKKTFSFWANAEESDDWRLWAKSAGIKSDELGNNAIREYIKNHPLSEEQRQMYDILKKRS